MSYGGDLTNMVGGIFGAGNAGRNLFVKKKPPVYNKTVYNNVYNRK